MGYFDFLIDQDNQPPQADQNYLYNLNMVWRPGELESIPIAAGVHLATNVKQLANFSYVFNLEGMDGKFCCNYGWAFVKATPDNLQQFARYLSVLKESLAVQERTKTEFNKVESLRAHPAV